MPQTSRLQYCKAKVKLQGLQRKAFSQEVRLRPKVRLHRYICLKGYKDGLQPETLADGNWLVKQNQPVSKNETKSDTNLRSLYES
jgi:hypothetical protein